MPIDVGGRVSPGRLDAAGLLADISKEISILQAATPGIDYMGAWSMLQRARPALILDYNLAVSKIGARK